MMDLLQRLFAKEETQSKNVAKERLRLVLVHDRTAIRPETLEDLKEDLLQVISKYLDIEKESMEVALNHEDSSVALVANIPVRKVKRGLSR